MNKVDKLIKRVLKETNELSEFVEIPYVPMSSDPTYQAAAISGGHEEEETEQLSESLLKEAPDLKSAIEDLDAIDDLLDKIKA